MNENIEKIIKETIRDLVEKEMANILKEGKGELEAIIQEVVKEKLNPYLTSGEIKVKAPSAREIFQGQKKPGRYLYCVAEGNKKISFGKIGIEGEEVYTIPYQDLCLVVHNSPLEPYQSEDENKVKEWVITHQKVIDGAWNRFGNILPLGFDTIIKSEKDVTPEENLYKWLEDDYENLKQKLDKFRGKAEYAVQISWDPKVIGRKLIETNEEIKKLDQEIKSKSEGAAYMYKEKLEGALKKEMEKEANRYFKDFYQRIKNCVDDIQIGKLKKEGGKQMLMNLSCLTNKDNYKELGEELEKIKNREGFFVHFTGPWPPYTFVSYGG